MAAIRMNNGVPILNGNTLAFDDDENCCCSTAPAGKCVGGPACGGDPSVEIILTSVDANLPIQWAGITWEKSVAGGGPGDPLGANQRRSGEEACVCPTTTYTKDTVGPTTSEYWENDGGAVSRRLSFRRQERSTGSENLYQHVAVRGYRSSFSGFTFGDYPYKTPAFSAAAPSAYPASGRTAGPFIPDKYFLTFTTAGVTYEVDRGERW